MDELYTEYLTLFNAVTDTAAALEALRQRLLLAQAVSEELYLARGEKGEGAA